MKYTLLLILLVSVNFKSLSQNYVLNGNTIATGDDCYDLTESQSNQVGSVWYIDQINLSEPFSIQFLINLGISDDGADGICFVLQTQGTSALGQNGGGLGYQNAFPQSLAVEFDTWINTNNGDISADHIAIQKNGDVNHFLFNNIAGPIQADPFDPNIEDGEDHVAQINWNPETQIISVFFDCVLRLQGNVDMVNTIFGGQNEVYFGFTASTGGAMNLQSVCLQENILSVGPQVDVCNGSCTQLSAGASSNGQYTWTPATYLDDPTSATPTACPPVPITYHVEFEDLCGNIAEADVLVNVVDLEAAITGPVQLDCYNPSINLNGEINIASDAIYTWSSNGNPLLSGTNESTFNVTEVGTYSLAVNAQNACFAESEVTVTSNFEAYVVGLIESDVIDCFSNPLLLSPTVNASDALFQWSRNDIPIQNANTQNYEATQPGSYLVDVVNPSSGCHSSATIELTSDFTTPSIIIADQNLLTCLNPVVAIEGVFVESDPNYSYSVNWSTSNGHIVSGSQSLSPSADEAGAYLITATNDITGCADTATVYLLEDEEFSIDLSSLSFPNIITNNGDSLNVEWRPFLAAQPDFDLLPLFLSYDLKVFDRWGKLVFEGDKNSPIWRPNDQERSVYFYILSYEILCGTGKAGVAEGNIQLVR
jgi:hypothetical protein